MNYRDFGKTGIKVSELGFGAWGIGGNEHGNSYGATDDKVSIEAINKAFELGCNFFDTADVYGRGHSEELLGKTIKGKRDKVIIATKVGSDFYQGPGFKTFSPEYIRFALEKSLERLRTDYIDVYQLHNPPIKRLNDPSTYQIMQELKREGKIRAWGVSVFDPLEGLAALRNGQPDSLQVAFNLFAARPYERLFNQAQESGCAIIAREVLSNGFLTGKYTEQCEFEAGDIRSGWPRKFISARVLAANNIARVFAGKRSVLEVSLQFVLENKQISVALIGIKTPEQAEEDFALDRAIQLSEDEITLLNQLQAANFNL